MAFLKARRLVVGISGVLVCGAAGAVQSFGVTPQENALCSALIFGGKDKHYYTKIEPEVGWEHTHHWCDCVRFRYRAIKLIGNRTEFSYILNEAVGGCDYVIRAARPGFRMLPKVHVDRGRALKLRGDSGEAVLAFQKAISLDPTEIHGYNELSLIQEERGQRAAARETVALGLQHNPESELLQKRYLELGGKEPFPVPVAGAVPIAPAPAPIRQQNGVEPAPPAVLELEPAEPTIAVDAQPGGASEANKQLTEDRKVEEDGSGRSCRFCPPEEIQRRWIESFKTDQQKKPE